MPGRWERTALASRATNRWVPPDPLARDEADEFILGDSIDLEMIDDSTHMGQTIEISDVVLERRQDGPRYRRHNAAGRRAAAVRNQSVSAVVDYISDESLDLDLSDTNYAESDDRN